MWEVAREADARYKSYRCLGHNKFFELNMYQKNPTQKHHWRADVDRPARNLDLE